MGRAAGGGRQRLWLARLGLVLHKRGSKSKLSVTRCCSEAASVAEQRILRQASLSTTSLTPHSKPLRSFLQRPPGTLISTIAAMAHQASGHCACEKTSLSRNRACFGYAFCASAARDSSSWLAIGFPFLCTCIHSAESAKPCRTTSDVRIPGCRCPTPLRPVFPYHQGPMASRRPT